MSHEPYFIHPNPTKEHMVCTPDGGILECKHGAAAQRVCELLNKLHAAALWFPATSEPPFRGVFLRKHPVGGVQRSYWNGVFWCVGDTMTASEHQGLDWAFIPGVAP